MRLPELWIESCRLAAGYALTISVPSTFKLLDDARAVSLVGLGLEYEQEHREGVLIKADGDRLSARPNKPVYALVGDREYETDLLLDWEYLDELEAERAVWRTQLRETR